MVKARRQRNSAFLALVLPLALTGCGSSQPVRMAGPAGSPSASVSPSAAPKTTPATCRFATQLEVGDAVGQQVYGWLEAAGGCWYLLDPQPGVLISVQITVFRNRVAQRDQGTVVVSGLGGNAYWNESTGYLVVQLGRDVLWVDTGPIRAADKLAPAKALAAIVRKRL